MNERLTVLSFTDGEAGGALGALYRYITVPCAMVIVAVYASPSADDADATIDINDDGAAAVSTVACATKATPGSWISTHFGGTQTPVNVAADSVLSLDANSVHADTRVMVQIWVLTGETY